MAPSNLATATSNSTRVARTGSASFVGLAISVGLLVACGSTQQPESVEDATSALGSANERLANANETLNEARGQVEDLTRDVVNGNYDRFRGFRLNNDDDTSTVATQAQQMTETEQENWAVDGQQIDEMIAEAIGLVFFPSGVFVDFAAYGEGDYSQWLVSGLEHAHWVEFAFLDRNPDGTELWRVAMSDREQPDPNDMVIVELLADRDPGQWQIHGARVRTLGMDDGVGVYASSGLTIQSSMRLQQADFSDYTQRTESIITSNSAFMTRVVGMQASGTAWTSWIFDDIPLGRTQIPGGIVHHELHGEDLNVVLDIVAWGEDATPLLPDVEIPTSAAAPAAGADDTDDPALEADPDATNAEGAENDGSNQEDPLDDNLM